VTTALSSKSSLGVAANRNTQLGMHGISNQPQHHGPVRQLAATWGMQPRTAKLDTISIKLPQGQEYLWSRWRSQDYQICNKWQMLLFWARLLIAT